MDCKNASGDVETRTIGGSRIAKYDGLGCKGSGTVRTNRIGITSSRASAGEAPRIREGVSVDVIHVDVVKRCGCIGNKGTGSERIRTSRGNADKKHQRDQKKCAALTKSCHQLPLLNTGFSTVY